MSVDFKTRDAVRATLDLVEKEYGVEVVHAVESGSRVWGFASPDSDWDVRFIYKRPLTWYLSVRERRDVIELPSRFMPLDVSGWDLRKACGLLMRSNPPLLEWLTSPTVYTTTGEAQLLKNMVARYFNSQRVIYHYLHMAVGNYRQYLKGEEVRLKKYFYVLRPLLCCQFVFDNNFMPPLEWDELLESTTNTIGTMDFPFGEVGLLLEAKKKASELGTGPRVDSINEWIETQIEKFSHLARNTTKLEVVGDDIDEIFYHMVTA